MADVIKFSQADVEELIAKINSAASKLNEVSSTLNGVNTATYAGGSIQGGKSISLSGLAVSRAGGGSVRENITSYRSAANALSAYCADLGRALSQINNLFISTENNLRRGHNTGGTTGNTAGSGGDNATGINLATLLGIAAQWVKGRAIPELLPFILPFSPFLFTVLASEYGVAGDVTTTASFLDYEFSEDHPGVTAWIAKLGVKAESDWASGSVNAYVGKAKADAELKGALMKYVKKVKEKPDGTVEEKEVFSILYGKGSVSASASVLSADVSGKVGDDNLGLGVKGDGSLLNAKAGIEGQVSLGEDGVNLYAKGEALVSAAEGKASTTISFLGFDITVGVSGYAGAAGVEGEIGIKDNKFVAKGGAAAVFGGGVDVQIGLNETGLERVKERATQIYEGASEFIDFVKFMAWVNNGFLIIF